MTPTTIAQIIDRVMQGLTSKQVNVEDLRAALEQEQAKQPKPVAWMRSVQCAGSPETPPEWDVEIVADDVQPDHGKGWCALYAEPPTPASVHHAKQEQAAQEPVAWLWEHVVNGSGAVKDRGLSFTEVEETNNTFWDGAISTKVTRLYAEPPTPPSVHQFAERSIAKLEQMMHDGRTHALVKVGFARSIDIIRAEAGNVAEQGQEIDMYKPCNLGVGCEEAGVCYASAHGQPDKCGKPTASSGTEVAEPYKIAKPIVDCPSMALPPFFQTTTCGECRYEESDGELIEQCALCKAADAARDQS